VSCDALNKAVICVGAGVRAREALETGIAGNTQGNPVSVAQLLKLSHNAVRNTRDTLGVEAVHHAADEVELVLQAEVDEIGVDENAIGRYQGGIVCEEKGRGYLWYSADGFCFLLFLLFLLLQLIFLPISQVR